MAAITPERVLADLEGAYMPTQALVSLTGPKFERFLKDPAFAEQAYAIIEGKIRLLVGDDPTIARSSALQNTLRGWEAALMRTANYLDKTSTNLGR